ncbi:MAG: choice-of-anchor J domain-containing protein [Xanthomarina sp.]
MNRKLLFILTMAFAFNGYAQIVYEEDFNDEATWANWTLEDRDGDGELWEFADAEFQEVESFQGGFVWSWSWFFETFTPDNTLISPEIFLPNNADKDVQLSFKVAAFEDDEEFEEHYAVYVIPANTSFTGTETPVFEETLDASYYNPPKTVNVDISSFAGQDIQLVFRHYDCTDVFYISMDDIKIEEIERQLGINDFTQNKVNIYPNPTSDIVSIQGVDKVNRIRVFNLQGKMMKEVNAPEASIKDLQSGMYLVNFYTDTHVFSRKVLKN